MLGYLRGSLLKFFDSSIILDVNGVGYDVSVPKSYITKYSLNDKIELFIETSVREDSISLFGFASLIEKQYFNLLTSVKGVGSKVGLNIIASFSPEQLANILVKQDKDAIATIPGIGPKLATRIVTELKDKGNIFGSDLEIRNNTENLVSTTSAVQADALSALTNLGYSRAEAVKAVAKIDVSNENSLGGVISMALKELSQ